MRIGIDATALPPEPVGAGNYIIQLIRSLTSLDSCDEWVIFAQKHGQELINLPEMPSVNWVLTAEKKPAHRLLWEQITLPGLAKTAKIELLHSLHYTRPVKLPCASVVTFHDMTFFLYPEYHTRAKRIFFPRAIHYSAKHAEALIAVSESTRRDAMKILKISPEKIHAIPLGINTEFHRIHDTQVLEDCRQKYDLPETFILYVGLVEPRKNLPLLLEAYHDLSAQTQSPPLVIVGRFGWGVEEVKQQITRLGIQERVIFTGYVPTCDLPSIYTLAEIFVYPSIYEGFGFPPLEAMACGAPTITSAVSAMQDHVGEAGVLLPPDDCSALTQAMLRLLNEPELRRKYAAAGPVRAAEFSWEKTAAKTREVYRQVLQK